MEIFTADNLIALVTLTAMEIVLGFDNIVVLSLLVNRLPKEKQDLARRLGLFLAMAMRILLLFSIGWLMLLTKPLFLIMSQEISGRDLVLLIGGLFLIAKATFELHDVAEGKSHEHQGSSKPKSFWSVIFQIIIFDLVFSLDSVITAVGMADHIGVMVLAIVIAMAVMMIFAKSVGEFIHEHPTLKVLALSFLVLIGVMLFAEGSGKHIERGYIYFAMAFSLAVEFINMKTRRVN